VVGTGNKVGLTTTGGSLLGESGGDCARFGADGAEEGTTDVSGMDGGFSS